LITISFKFAELKVRLRPPSPSSGDYLRSRLYTEFDDSYSSYSRVIGDSSPLARSSSSSSISSLSARSSAFFSFLLSSLFIYGSSFLSLSDPPKLSVSTVKFFLTAGVLVLVPVLFSDDFYFVTVFTFPFRSSFYLANAELLACFSSSALH